MSRTKSSVKNFAYGFLGQGLGLLVNFISRIFFIQILGSEYLGLNGLFTNILTVLSLAELGVGSAIVYSLYKPIADNDVEKCKTLMKLYKTYYTIIGIFVLVIGLSLTPFLHVFIKEMPDINNLQIIYMLFVANTSVSYFFSYKRNLIIANQNRYIASIYRYGFLVLLNILQIIYLIIYKDYIGFVVLQVLFTFLENFFISIRADKLYPYLRDKEVKKIDVKTKKEITTNVKALIIHKVGNIAVNSTDNIILSKFVGLTAVGLYSNYYMITYALNVIIGQLFTSMTASIGNLCASEKIEKQYGIFKNINFLNFWIYAFSSICLLILFNPFIELWLGKEYLFSFNVVIILVVNFFISGLRKSVLAFREAKGLYYQDRYKPVLESIINIVTSILLAKKFGVFGVFLGTFISSITTCVWMEPFVLYKYGFEKKSNEYFEDYFKKLILTILIGLITYFLCDLINGIVHNVYIVFIVKLLICLIIPNLILLVIYHNRPEFKYFVGRLKLIVKKKF